MSKVMDSRKGKLIDINRKIQNAYKNKNYWEAFVLLHALMENTLRVILYFQYLKKSNLLKHGKIPIDEKRWETVLEIRYYALTHVLFVAGILSEKEFEILRELNKARIYFAHYQYYFKIPLKIKKSKKVLNLKKIFKESFELYKELVKREMFTIGNNHNATR